MRTLPLTVALLISITALSSLAVPPPAATRPATRPATPPATQPDNVAPGPITPTGKRVVFILDGTGSMMPTFNFVKQDALAVIDALPAGTAFAVMVPKENAPLAQQAPRLVLASPEMKQKARALIVSQSAAGGGGLSDAIKQAGSLGADEVILFTDGDIGLPPERKAAHDLAVAQHDKRRAKFDVVLYDASTNAEFMEKFATDTGGAAAEADVRGRKTDPSLESPAQPKPRAPVIPPARTRQPTK